MWLLFLKYSLWVNSAFQITCPKPKFLKGFLFLPDILGSEEQLQIYI